MSTTWAQKQKMKEEYILPQKWSTRVSA